MPIELLAPAGDMERLYMAVHYGADAVYLGGENYNMRSGARNFSAEEMKNAIAYAHENGVRVYVTCNAIMHNKEIGCLPEYLSVLESVGADAVIAGDISVLSLCKRHAPSLPIHISTQAGVCNYETARAFYEMGADRIILARELSFDEIREIRDKTPDILEIEAFVHGSMCVSFSGRCLLSSYMTGRDANSGNCAQPCRWKYHLVEEKRPDEYFEIIEDGGTYILNAKDLCMIEYIPQLAEAGITSFKLEGRMRSAYYTATITNAYRMAIDRYHSEAANIGVDIIDEVNKVSHRPYSAGFYFEEKGPEQHYATSSYIRDYDQIAVVEGYDGSTGIAFCTQRNRFFLGDTVELLRKGKKSVEFEIKSMTGEDGAEVTCANHPMMKLFVHIPVKAEKFDILRKRKMPYKTKNAVEG